jgi:hypothetical protein
MRRTGRSTPGGRMVHVCAEVAAFTTAHGSNLPGGTPLGRRDSKFCLGVGRPAKMPPEMT